MKNLIILITLTALIALTYMSCADDSNTPATDTPSITGIVDGDPSTSARLAAEGTSADFDLDGATVEIKSIDDQGNENSIASGIQVQADGTFQANVPDHAKNLKVCATNNNGQKKCSFFPGEVDKDKENYVEPITDESDMLTDLVQSEIGEGTAVEDVDVEEMADWIDPKVANRIRAIEDTTKKDCVIGLLRRALFQAREAFANALADKNVSREQIQGISTKLREIRLAIREERKNLLKELHDAIKAGDHDTYLDARLAHRETMEAIFEEAGIPRPLYAKAQQIAHEAFEHALFDAVISCDVDPAILRIIYVKAIMRKMDHDAKVMGFVLKNEFEYDAKTGIVNAFEQLKTAVEGFDFDNPINTDLENAVGTFYAALLVELKAGVADVVTETVIDTLNTDIAAAQETLKTSLESATTPMQIKESFVQFHATVFESAQTNLELTKDTPRDEAAPKLMIFDMLMIMHSPLHIRP